MGVHARLSPSGASRWMVCPGSVALSATLPPQSGSSEYAAKGTAIHALSEHCLKTSFSPAEFLNGELQFKGYTVTQEMVDIAQAYISFVDEVVGTKHYEVRVSLEEVIPDCFGTADTVAMRPGHLSVIDLKTGAGNRVDPEANKQLLLYALGAYLKYDWMYDFEEVTLAIVQPPLNNFSSWTITTKELLAFADQVKEAYVRIVNEPTTYVPDEKACQWCQAKRVCPEMHKLANEAAAADFGSLAEDDISVWLRKVPMIKQFIDAVESHAKDKLLAGGTIDGFKVVEGRKTRAWGSPDNAVIQLTKAGLANVIFSKPELLSPAQVEKALKTAGEKFDITPLLVTKAGSPTIVPEDDKRPAINKTAQAAKDFEG